MNILFVAANYPERGQPAAGFPNYLYRVSLSLLRMGHKPIIVTAGRWDNNRIDQSIEIITVQVIKKFDLQSRELNYAVNALYKGYILNKKIKEIIKKRHIDIIQFTSLEGLALFYRESVPAILRLSSYAKTYFSSLQTFSEREVQIRSLIERLSAIRCNAVFAPCRNTAEAFSRDIKRKVNVIESPFVNDVQEYDLAFVERYLNDKKYVLFFGTFYAEKGIWVLADILEKFLADNPRMYFVFVGNAYNTNGENTAQILQRKAGKYKERIIISTAILHDQLYPVIMRADFVVLPSLMDNMPNACIEAMYFERVVIGTDGASFEQLITHGKSGLLCKIGDSDDLLKRMQMAVSMSDQEKIQMGRNARKRIDELRPEISVGKLVRMYEYVITKNKCRRNLGQ